MAYDEALAARIEDILTDHPGVTQRRMFGGLAWLLHGNMAVVARNDGDLMIRVGPAAYEAMLTEPGATTALMRNRPMRGWITVTAQTPNLPTWVNRGLTYAQTLPPK